MKRSRLFEEAVIKLWDDGKISGEMHLGIGEEAIVAGVVSCLQGGDAMALDHRGTPPLLIRGVDPVVLLKEFLGRSDGLCGGMGGHMHLFAPQYLSASSGIVGASGPAAAGFALAARHLRPGALSVAFFGEGAMNQGMLLESMNLAVVWKLPVLFVCKDNRWAITTSSPSVTGGTLVERAKGFGLYARKVDGWDVETVAKAAAKLMRRIRKGGGPAFLHTPCVRPEGHFLGDALLRVARHPLHELKQLGGPLMKAALRKKGASPWKRAVSLSATTSIIAKTAVHQIWKRHDPLIVARRKLKWDKLRLNRLDENLRQEIDQAVAQAMMPAAEKDLGE
jgi:pyruvate dehydrogenase E1 component alpha subunit